MNPQELFIDVSSGRFLDGRSTTPIVNPKVFSNEERELKINVLQISRNAVTAYQTGQNSRLKARLGTASAKLAEQVDLTVPTVALQASAIVVTVPASASTASGVVDIFTTITASIIASISSIPAVTATVVADIIYISPVTASITCGITTTTVFPKIQSFPIPLKDNLSENQRFIYLSTNNTPSQRQGSFLLARVVDFTPFLNSPIQATFSVSVTGGAITKISIATRGVGYPNGEYDVTFTGGGVTTTASAIATCSGGSVVSVSLIDGGAYSSVPGATLFTPAKSLLTILPTGLIPPNRDQSVGYSAGHFRWCRGLTTTSQPRIPLTFSSPDVSDATAVTPTRTPEAYLEYVPEARGLTRGPSVFSGGGEFGNLWKLVITDTGYGYSSVPSVSHGEAFVSSYVFAASPKLFASGLYKGKPGEFWIYTEDITETPVKIGYKGCALIPSIRYKPGTKSPSQYVPIDFVITKSFFTEQEISELFFVSPIWFSAMYEGYSGFPAPLARAGYVQKDGTITPFETVSPSDQRKPAYLNLGGDGELFKYQQGQSQYFPEWITNSIAPYNPDRSDGWISARTIDASLISENPNTLHNKIKFNFPETNKNFGFAMANYSSVGIFRRFGGIFSPNIQMLDYGAGYDYDIINNQGVARTEKGILPITETIPGAILNETFFAVPTVTIPNTITNGILNSNFGNITVATQIGNNFTQTFIDYSGALIFSQPYAEGVEVVVTGSPGTVTTARLLNEPKVYNDGTYKVAVQSPTGGVPASIDLVIEGGISRVVVKNGGNGYTSAPVLTAPSPNALNGFISSARLTNSPNGYNLDQEYPLVVSASPISGGTAKITLFRTIDGYNARIDSPGFGYQSSPIVTAPAPNKKNIGTLTNLVLQGNPSGYSSGKSYSLQISASADPEGQAFGELRISESGVADAVILNSGFGYVTAPAVTAPGPDRLSGSLVSVVATTFGRGFPVGVYPCIVTTAPEGGETARVSFEVFQISPRRISAPAQRFVIDSPGFGYVTAPVISTLTPPNNAIESISITCQGTFYTDQTATFEIADSTGAGAIFGAVVVSQGKISSIPVIYGGGNYSNPSIKLNQPELPSSEVIPPSQIRGVFNITTASANAILATANQRDILLEVYETDGTNEQVVVQGTVNLAKRVLE